MQRADALERLMDWFTAALITATDPNGGGDEEADERAFVALGRSILHTKAAKISFGATIPEMHRDVWSLVAAARFLSDGSGGGALFVAPSFNNFEIFDDFAHLVSSGLRHLVSTRLCVRAYHPLHPTPARRSPVPALHAFLDSDELFASSDSPIIVI